MPYHGGRASGLSIKCCPEDLGERREEAMDMCSAQLFSVSFGITSKSSLQFHLPLSLFFKWTSCGPSFQSHEKTLGDNWAGQTCQSCKKEAFVWPWRDILSVALCFGDMELEVGFPLPLPLSMGPNTWHVSSCPHPCPETSYFPYYCQVAS